MKLENKPDGSFLVRDSSDDRYILSLSFRSQGVIHHTRIEHYKGESEPSAALSKWVVHCRVNYLLCYLRYIFLYCRLDSSHLLTVSNLSWILWILMADLWHSHVDLCCYG